MYFCIFYLVPPYNQLNIFRVKYHRQGSLVQGMRPATGLTRISSREVSNYGMVDYIFNIGLGF